MIDWLLDRFAHLFFRRLPYDIYRRDERWWERLHMWGLERCAQRHFDDPRCWTDVTDEVRFGGRE